MSVSREILQAVQEIRRAIGVIETLSDPPHMKGYAFEKHFLFECRRRGLRACKQSGGHVDLLVVGKRVQCKCVTPNSSGQVFIQPGQRTWYLPEDFDVLAMKCGEITYIIPMECLPKTNGHVRIQIRPTSFRRFIDAWGVFSGDVMLLEQSLFPVDEEATDGTHP